MHVIKAFFKHHNEHELNRLRDEAEAIGNLGRYLLLAQGVKKAESDWINSWQFRIKATGLREVIPKAVAETYVKLYRDHKLHNWVVKMTPLENMELRAKI